MANEIIVVGSLNLDMVASVPRNPNPGETITGTGFHWFIGGKGANQAAAAAQLGAPVKMIGRHGTDGFAESLLQTLREKGVDTSAIAPAEGPSGIAVILVTPEGQNSIVVIPGANSRLSPADVAANRILLVEAAFILSQLETPMDTLEATAEVAAYASVPLILDPAPVQPLSSTLLRAVTWLTPNETEAATMLNASVPKDTSSIRAFAESLLALGSRNILLKLGARGAYLATAGGHREHIPAIAVEAVDSTAAGDALNGAFAAALLEGATPVEAARFAVAAASLSVTRPGAIPSLPTRGELETFLANQIMQQK